MPGKVEREARERVEAAQRREQQRAEEARWRKLSKEEQQREIEAAERQARREQREQEAEAEFELFREAQAEARKKGVHLTQATFKTRTEGDQRVIRLTSAKGTPTREAQEKARREVEAQQEFELFRLAKSQGKDISELSIRRDEFGRIQTARAIYSQRAQFEPQYEYRYEKPEYNIQFGSKKIGDIVSEEVAKGDEGLYGSRTVYDYDAVKDYLGSYKKEFFGPPEPVEFYGPPSPFSGDVIRVWNEQFGPPEPKKEEPIDFLAGFNAPIENLFEMGRAGIETVITGKRVEPTFKPEIEADFYNIFLKAAKSAVEGKEVSIVKDFEEFSKNLQTRPVYYAGSAAGSAAFFIATLGAGPAIKAGSTALKVRGASKVLSPLGDIATVEKDLINIGKEGDFFRYSVGRTTKVGREPAIEFFNRFTAQSSKDFIQPLSKTTQYFGYQLKGIKEGVRPFSSEFIVKGGQLNFPEFGAGARGETLFKVARPQTKVVATSETFTLKELEKTLSTPEGTKKFLGLEDDFLRIEGSKGPSRPPKPFDFGVEAKGQEVTKQALKEMGIVGKEGSELANMAKAAGISTGAFRGYVSSQYASLGFGGLTGAERKRSGDVFDYGYERLAYPPGTSIISDYERMFRRGGALKLSIDLDKEIRSIIGIGFSGKEGVRKSSDLAILQKMMSGSLSLSRSMENLGFKSLFGTGLKESPTSGLKIDTGLKTIPFTATLTGQAERTSRITTTETTFKIPPFFDFPPGFDLFKTKKRKKGKKSKFQQRTFVVTPILKATLGFNNRFARDFEKAFGRFY